MKLFKAAWLQVMLFLSQSLNHHAFVLGTILWMIIYLNIEKLHSQYLWFVPVISYLYHLKYRFYKDKQCNTSVLHWFCQFHTFLTLKRCLQLFFKVLLNACFVLGIHFFFWWRLCNLNQLHVHFLNMTSFISLTGI